MIWIYRWESVEKEDGELSSDFLCWFTTHFIDNYWYEPSQLIDILSLINSCP